MKRLRFSPEQLQAEASALWMATPAGIYGVRYEYGLYGGQRFDRFYVTLNGELASLSFCEVYQASEMLGFLANQVWARP